MTRSASMIVTAAALSLVALAACTAKARTYSARVSTVPSIGVSPLPLRAAIIVPEAVRAAAQRQELQCGFSSMPMTLQTGQAVEKDAQHALSQTVEKADVFRDRASAGSAFDLYVDLAPAEVSLEADCGLFGWERPTFESRATVKARVLDRHDRVLLEETYGSLPQRDERVSEAAGKALADAMHALAMGVMSSTPIRAAAKLGPLNGGSSASAVKLAERERPAPPRAEAPGKPESTGVGFAIGYDYYLTAYHVIAGMPNLTVYQGERPVAAALILRDRLTDLALLKLSASTEHPALSGLRFGDPTKAREGDTVWTLDLSGDGPGRALTHEGRIVSMTGPGGDPRVFQLSVPGPQRHSGAPLLNQAGEVIGIALAPKETPRVFQASDNGSDDLVVAVKIQYAKALVNLLPESEYVAPAPTRTASQPDAAKPQLVYIEARR